MHQKAIFIFAIAFAVSAIFGWSLLEESVSGSPPAWLSPVEDKTSIGVTFLDVGQGDATFVEWPDKTQMLIDCAKDAHVLEALGRVMKFYDSEIDYLVVTHPDLDHYGGCTDVLKRFTIRNLIFTGLPKHDPAWQVLVDTAEKEGLAYHRVSAWDTWTIASSTLTFLYPDHDVALDPFVPDLGKDTGDNNTSVVILLVYGQSDVLLMGDAEKELEAYLVKRYGEKLDAEVLKVGHHGSGSSTSKPFLETVTPAHAIISVGEENRYGHPSPRVMKRLERAGANIWRTDQDGDIHMKMREDSIAIGM